MSSNAPSTPASTPAGPSTAAAQSLAEHLGLHLLPNPEESPTVLLWPTAGRALLLSRNGTYEAAKRGEIPVIVLGRRKVVPTAALRRMLQLDEPTRSAPAA